MPRCQHLCLLVWSVCFLQSGVSLLHIPWTERSLQSPVAKELERKNSRCTPGVNSYVKYGLNNYGMGSTIGTCLLKAACNALNEGSALRTVGSGPSNNWIWVDEDFCEKQAKPYSISNTGNPLQCYFGNVFTPCPDDSPRNIAKNRGIFWQSWKCPKYIPHNGNFSAIWEFSNSATEYLFSQLNPEIVKLVEKEVLNIFGPEGAPSNMITVHIRWGDKKHEMGGSLVVIDEYVKAVKFFVRKHRLDKVNIFLTTEDPKASRVFRSHEYVVANEWKVYEYTAAISENNELHTPALDATRTKGKFGLISMIVLLLSLEGQYFVLTTASNWSVLIRSLALGIAKQHRTVDYIDLRRNPLTHKAQYEFNAKQKLPRNYPYNSDGVLAFPLGSAI